MEEDQKLSVFYAYSDEDGDVHAVTGQPPATGWQVNPALLGGGPWEVNPACAHRADAVRGGGRPPCFGIRNRPLRHPLPPLAFACTSANSPMR